MVTFLTENLSIRCLAILLLVFSLILCVYSPSPNFFPSSRYLSTGNSLFIVRYAPNLKWLFKCALDDLHYSYV